jgi:metal-sulfur cluster biosynthetic enzyme
MNELNEIVILEKLKEVIDPELGCNLVDLGLIYGVRIEGAKVSIKMTLTTPGCPMHESLAYGVQSALLSLPGVEDVDVEVVWDPPWTPEMMTEDGQATLGMR